MICKVQIATAQDSEVHGDERLVLIYDKLWKESGGESGFHMLTPLTTEISVMIGPRWKAYFQCRIRHGLRKKKFSFVKEVPPQPW